MISQTGVEAAWLNLIRRVTASDNDNCICRLTKGARWSGYLGSKFVHPKLNNRRVLFVGANHNGGATGLLKTPQMEIFNKNLKSWAAEPGSHNADQALLAAMRDCYKTSWPAWGAVWNIFGAIRSELQLGHDEFAFVNLARCPSPDAASDDVAIVACQKSFPLDELVRELDARVIFLAKGGAIGRKVFISGEDAGKRLVIRYGNGSRGARPGAPHYTHWLSDECAKVQAFINSY